MNNYDKKIFCVYGYKLDNVWIYIGNGIALRPYSPTGRSDRFKNLLRENSIDVVILADKLSKSEAEHLEGEYLGKYYGKEVDGWKLENKQPKSKVKEISYEFCSKLWFYDETSPTCLRWLVGRSSNIHPGDVAGSILKIGYANVETANVNYRVHRIVYVLNTKKDLSVDLIVDHIDSNPLNNKIENLQAITRQANSSKKSKHINNTTGYTGVHWHSVSQSWRASICINYIVTLKHFYVVDYASSNEALDAAKAYRKYLETLR